MAWTHAASPSMKVACAHFEREGVLPIAFSLFHYVNMHDASFMLLTGEAPIWNDDWQERVQLTIADHGKHKTVDEMIHQRIGDYEAFKEYLRAVMARTEAWLDGLDPAELSDHILDRADDVRDAGRHRSPEHRKVDDRFRLG